MNLYTRTEYIITVLVESILCKDSADTQYMTNNMPSCHSFQGFGVEMTEILVRSPYGQYKMSTYRTGQNE